MSRSRIFLVVLAMSLLASACVEIYELEKTPLRNCDNLDVGEQTTMYVGNSVGPMDEEWWTHDSGPGTIDGSIERQVEYTATEPGEVFIYWTGEKHFVDGSAFRVEFVKVTTTAGCSFEVFELTAGVRVGFECETSRFKVEISPTPVAAFDVGYIEFDTNVSTIAGMNYDTSEFDLSVGGDEDLLAATMDPRVSQPGDTSQSFSWQVTIDRVTGQNLLLGEHQLEVTVTEIFGAEMTSCTLPFKIYITQYGG